jgi:hypothetical protein
VPDGPTHEALVAASLADASAGLDASTDFEASTGLEASAR